MVMGSWGGDANLIPADKAQGVRGTLAALSARTSRVAGDNTSDTTCLRDSGTQSQATGWETPF